MNGHGWVRIGPVRARPDAEEEVAILGLAGRRTADPAGARVLRLAPLHRTLLLPGTGGGERILKVHRGRPMLDLLRDLPSGRALLPSARIECENLLELRARGFSVPEPLAWGKNGPESFALLRPVRGTPLDAWLRGRGRSDPRARGRVLRELAALLARFHGERRFHRDLYACHVLVGAHGGLSLIDLARARRGRLVRRRWFVKDLAALASSVPSPPTSRTDRVRFLRAYLSARGRAGELRAWALAVERRVARLRARGERGG
ncbi:MAG TPA: lipopolysaccharide kinase InaA family protein [Planctomycetota bacterium]|jgi:tRNA A-37 threonylcarbamoyl transferase component Bud32|nr:lipopolysaccharide kinase InaA family protein [Planctomycetota bacterium]